VQLMEDVSVQLIEDVSVQLIEDGTQQSSAKQFIDYNHISRSKAFRIIIIIIINNRHHDHYYDCQKHRHLISMKAISHILVTLCQACILAMTTVTNS